MTPDDPQVHALTGAYALDALTDEERVAFEAHLEVCEPCAQETAELQATVADLGGMLREAPSEGLRDAVLAAIEQTPQDHVAVTERPETAPDRRDAATVAVAAPRGGVPRWLAWAGAAAAAVAAVAAIALGVQLAAVTQELDEVAASQERMEALLAAPDVETLAVTAEDGTEVRVVLSVSLGAAMLMSSDMDQAPHAHTYEAWVIDDEGPRPAGVFDADEDGRVSVMIEDELAGATAIGVTIEPEGGSPQPTTDPVMLVPLES